MMAAIFAVLTAALAVGWFGSRRAALILISATLLLAIHLFLWEIYSPEYGFSMPWIDT
jgi:hypothetical protein